MVVGGWRLERGEGKETRRVQKNKWKRTGEGVREDAVGVGRGAELALLLLAAADGGGGGGPGGRERRIAAAPAASRQLAGGAVVVVTAVIARGGGGCFVHRRCVYVFGRRLV